jgi:hypothetical protein
MKIIYSASISLLASARSASAATAFNYYDCRHFCGVATDGRTSADGAPGPTGKWLVLYKNKKAFTAIAYADCVINCAKSCDGRTLLSAAKKFDIDLAVVQHWNPKHTTGFDISLCKVPCHIYRGGDQGCMDNCDAKACPASSSSECDANLVDMTKDRDAAKSERDAAKSELVAMTSERDAAKSERNAALRSDSAAKSERDAAKSERDAAKSELVAMTSERDAAKECKAKSPNYKAPVNDECNPKNCDEWDCGQWCVCYNADDDAIYERLGCAADDEETCQCD